MTDSESQFGLSPERANESRPALHGLQAVARRSMDLVQISGAGVGDLAVLQVVPDLLDRIEFGSIRRQVQEGDVVGDVEVVGDVPAGTVEDKNGVRALGDLAAELGQMQGQGFGVGLGQDEGCGCGTRRADGAEDVGPFVAAVARAARPCSTSGPDPRQRPLLAEPGLVLDEDTELDSRSALAQGVNKRGASSLNFRTACGLFCSWRGRGARHESFRRWSRA